MRNVKYASGVVIKPAATTLCTEITHKSNAAMNDNTCSSQFTYTNISVIVSSNNSCQVSVTMNKFIFTRHNVPVHFHKVLVYAIHFRGRTPKNKHSQQGIEILVVIVGLNKGFSLLAHPVTG